MVDITAVIPVFNEENTLNLLYEKVSKVLSNLQKKYEIIFIDDGSSDRSFTILSEIAKKDNNILIIKFSRNFGQTAALHAGFQKSSGSIIITLDADLQNNPDDIPKLLEELNHKNAAVVSGWRYPRRDSFLRYFVSAIANRIISKICGLRLHDYGCTLKAYKSEYVKELKLYGEMHRLIPALIHWNGGEVVELKVTHSPRIYGKSAYGMGRTHRVILDLLTAKFLSAYSTKPIHVFGSLGLVSIILGIFISVYVLIRKIYLGGAWISPLFFISVFLVGLGMIFILLGIIAEIVVRIYFSQTGNLPYKLENIE